jgi:hypothetical protein
MRLITRAGNDFSSRFPFIAMAVSELPVRSCLIDGEAIVCNDNGLAVFELIRRHGVGEHAVLSAFDLLELDEEDLRRKAIETRKALLAKLLKRSHLSLVLNEHYEEDGAITKMSRGDVRRPSCSPKMRRGGSRRISPSCRSWCVRLRGGPPGDAGCVLIFDLHQCLRISDRSFYTQRLRGFVMTPLASEPRRSVEALSFSRSPSCLSYRAERNAG